MLAWSLLLLAAIASPALAQLDVQKFLPHEGGIPDSWIVLVRAPSGDDVPEIASRLTQQYGGELGHVYQHALHGFSVTMPAEAARALSMDPAVASVSQDMEVHTTDTQTNPAIQPSLPPPSSVVLLGKVKAAHHTCDRPVARDRRVPLCVAEIAARAQRLLGDPHPTLRSWVRTTYGRARIAAPIAKPRLRAKPVLVVRLVGTFPQGGSPANPYGRFREVRFQVDPATRRVVGWQTVPVETMTPLPPLGRLGHSHRF